MILFLCREHIPNSIVTIAGANYVEQIVQFESLSTYYLRPLAAEDPEVLNAGTEQLTRPKQLSTSCFSVVSNPLRIGLREIFGYTVEDRVYVVPHPPHKFHPDFDGVLAEILVCDPRYVLWRSR